jgi:cysteinyl-tRNA synthetase
MIRVFNTLSGQKEDFVPQGDTVRMYVCGVTPYAECHLGHAMSYIVFDTVRRYLEFRGYKVKYVQNFTDVDDKIIARANERGVPSQQLAEQYISQYFEDIDALNVKRADVYPRATEEIPKIIEIVQGLIEKGHAYESNGDVYFRVSSDHDYGKLSHRNLDEMVAGARVEVTDAKEHPLDFTLWKATKPGEPHWQSPWGEGRPGWHIECSAMSLKYLGETLDIHGGGLDLVFPHHENEIAQSECYTSVKPFVRYWLHNGLMQLGEEKMSKSSGKLISISDALEMYSADALRLWVLSSLYRGPITYSDWVLSSIEKGVERLRHASQIEDEASANAYIDPAPYRTQFLEAMDDDFGTPQAIAVLFDLAREINRGHTENLRIVQAQEVLRELAGVLGLTLQEQAVPELTCQPFIELADRYGLSPDDSSQPEQEMIASCIRLLMSKRSELRQQRNWQLADSIRDELLHLGITLEDTSQGTVWRYRKP